MRERGGRPKRVRLCGTHLALLDLRAAAHRREPLRKLRHADKRAVRDRAADGAVKAAVAQACETQVAGIRVLLDGVELNDSARISLRMKCLQVIFHEDYLIIMRMKGNMKKKT